jgi:hypothetical protein
MDDFLRLSDEDKNQKANLTAGQVDRERIERLKRSFLPFWMRWMAEQRTNPSEAPSKNKSGSTSTESN